MTVNTKKIFSWDTDYSADSAEFCPIENYLNFLAIGTYQLEESNNEIDNSEESKPTKRVGKLYLKNIENNENPLLVQTIHTSAILDMKWCRKTINGFPILAIVTSVGETIIYKLTEKDQNMQLEFCDKFTIDEALILSLDWSNSILDEECPRIVTSDSRGYINLLQVKNLHIDLLQSFKAHEFEAWISAFNYWNPNIIYTGGDDSKFRGFDLRCDPAVSTFTNKSHLSGVTSIQSNTNHEHQLANGSYDEIVNIWDTRNMKKSLKSKNLGGGIWRVKWEPYGRDLLLTACMYNGFHVINTENELEIHASFNEHKSIAYGCDWYYKTNEDDSTVASVSFYDHLFCLWKFENKCS